MHGYRYDCCHSNVIHATLGYSKDSFFKKEAKSIFIKKLDSLWNSNSTNTFNKKGEVTLNAILQILVYRKECDTLFVQDIEENHVTFNVIDLDELI